MEDGCSVGRRLIGILILRHSICNQAASGRNCWCEPELRKAQSGSQWGRVKSLRRRTSHAPRRAKTHANGRATGSHERGPTLATPFWTPQLRPLDAAGTAEPPCTFRVTLVRFAVAYPLSPVCLTTASLLPATAHREPDLISDVQGERSMKCRVLAGVDNRCLPADGSVAGR